MTIRLSRYEMQKALESGSLPFNVKLPKAKKQKATEIPAVVWKTYGIPEPVREHRFCERLWRLDFAWPEIDYELVHPQLPVPPGSKLIVKLALEVEGGIWKQGRHNRPKSMIEEMEKYNRLTCLGWRLLRCTPEDVQKGRIFATIREALGLEKTNG